MVCERWWTRLVDKIGWSPTKGRIAETGELTGGSDGFGFAAKPVGDELGNGLRTGDLSVIDETRDIVQRVRAGDEVAMRDLVDRYASRVLALCQRMLGHRQDAEDAAQETFVRMFRSLARWDADRPFEPWLMAIAGNRCRTRLAKRSATPRCVELEEPDLATSDRSESAVRQINEELRLALNEVTPRYREAFLGFHERGWSYAQIAARLEVPLGTVKTWVRRARLQLMGQLRARGTIEESHHELRQV